MQFEGDNYFNIIANNRYMVDHSILSKLIQNNTLLTTIKNFTFSIYFGITTLLMYSMKNSYYF